MTRIIFNMKHIPAEICNESDSFDDNNSSTVWKTWYNCYILEQIILFKHQYTKILTNIMWIEETLIYMYDKISLRLKVLFMFWIWLYKCKTIPQQHNKVGDSNSSCTISFFLMIVGKNKNCPKYLKFEMIMINC